MCFGNFLSTFYDTLLSTGRGERKNSLGGREGREACGEESMKEGGREGRGGLDRDVPVGRSFSEWTENIEMTLFSFLLPLFFLSSVNDYWDIEMPDLFYE